jgi:hypothetical protein
MAKVVLVFSDGRELSAKAFDLRANCACACVSQKSRAKRLVDTKKIPADINPKKSCLWAIMPSASPGAMAIPQAFILTACLEDHEKNQAP